MEDLHILPGLPHEEEGSLLCLQSLNPGGWLPKCSLAHQYIVLSTVSAVQKVLAKCVVEFSGEEDVYSCKLNRFVSINYVGPVRPLFAQIVLMSSLASSGHPSNSQSPWVPLVCQGRDL